MFTTVWSPALTPVALFTRVPQARASNSDDHDRLMSADYATSSRQRDRAFSEAETVKANTATLTGSAGCVDVSGSRLTGRTGLARGRSV